MIWKITIYIYIIYHTPFTCALLCYSLTLLYSRTNTIQCFFVHKFLRCYRPGTIELINYSKNLQYCILLFYKSIIFLWQCIVTLYKYKIIYTYLFQVQKHVPKRPIRTQYNVNMCSQLCTRAATNRIVHM